MQKITAYIGFDCTAPSLHVGSLLPIMMLHWLQYYGHTPIALMGGGTTRVGDPSGKDESRQLLSDETINENLKGIRETFSSFLLFEDDKNSVSFQHNAPALSRLLNLYRGNNPAIMANNADWLNGLKYVDFLREVGRHFSVNRMLAFELGEAAARAPAGTVVTRIQLHDLAGLRLRRASPALRLRAADGRLRPMGQHRQRYRSGPAFRKGPAFWFDVAAHYHVLGRQNGQNDSGSRLAQSRSNGFTSIGSTGAIPRTPTWNGS